MCYTLMTEQHQQQTDWEVKMNIKATITSIVLLSSLALSGCAASEPAVPSVASGKAEVIDRIKAEKDCTKLQADFDLADKNGKLARDNGKLDLAQANTTYMQAALDRQTELKC